MPHTAVKPTVPSAAIHPISRVDDYAAVDVEHVRPGMRISPVEMPVVATVVWRAVDNPDFIDITVRPFAGDDSIKTLSFELGQEHRLSVARDSFEVI